MTTSLVILAAGRGSRTGRFASSFHKALLPLERKAIITHIIDSTPHWMTVYIAVGDRAQLIMDYCALAHPTRNIIYVYVPGWDDVGGGPGHSLMCALSVIPPDDGVLFTACDTLFTPHAEEWSQSWIGVAHMPPNTPPERWCRVTLDDVQVTGVLDKTTEHPGELTTFVGAGFIHRDDRHHFTSIPISNDGETQVSPAIATSLPLAMYGRWIDIGSEAAYRQAVILRDGFDWSKTDEATYIVGDKVIKYHKSAEVTRMRCDRAHKLCGVVPRVDDTPNAGPNWMRYEFVPGINGYDAVEQRGVEILDDLLEWASGVVWTKRHVHDNMADSMRTKLSRDFYEVKTHERVDMLPQRLKAMARAMLRRVPWYEIHDQFDPCTMHGDFNLGNLILSDHGWVGIDWRDSMCGSTNWGDRRYDMGKLLAGCVVNWRDAQEGRWRPWPFANASYDRVRAFVGNDRRDIEMIGALSLLNSAPLHESPLDEILVVRGCAWLEELL